METRKHSGVSLLIVLLALACASGLGMWYVYTNEADKQAAFRVAEAFLKAVESQDGRSAYALLTKDHRDRLTDQERATKQMQVPEIYGQAIAYHDIYSPSTAAGMIYEGWVRARSGQNESKFRMVMVKEKENASWRVDLFTIELDPARVPKQYLKLSNTTSDPASLLHFIVLDAGSIKMTNKSDLGDLSDVDLMVTLTTKEGKQSQKSAKFSRWWTSEIIELTGFDIPGPYKTANFRGKGTRGKQTIEFDLEFSVAPLQ